MAEAFPGIGKIKFEGPTTKNMLAFRHYDADALVEGKPMRDHLRFAVSYWHTMRGTGGDPFGPGTMVRPWETESDPLKAALNRVDVAFEFLEKLGCDFYCFHDRDVAPEGATLAESNKHFDAVADALEKHVDHAKALKTEEARLTRRIKNIREQRVALLRRMINA